MPGRKSVLILLALSFSAFLPAQQFDPALYAGLRWRMIGPFRGGRVITVAGVPEQRDTYYFGSVDGGIWKTTNAGVTWQPIFDQAPVQSIGAIAIAPSNPEIIYVGTGEADMRASISFGNGVYKSSDGGRTWQHLGLTDSQQIGKILIAPHDPNVVFVAVMGHPYGPNPERGLFRSTDGGQTWKKVLYKDENTGAMDLAFDPSDSRTIYAALWQTHRPPWSQYPPIDGPGSGLYKSTDGGNTWKQITGGGFPAGEMGRIGIAVAPSNPRRIYAVIDQDSKNHTGKLYRSDDVGANWQLVNGSDRRIDGRAWYFSQVIVDPKNADIVYLPNVSLYRSSDGGKNFVAIKGAPGGDDYHALWIDPSDPERMIQGSDQGVSVSVDGGSTWTSWFNQPTAQFYHVAVDNQFPYWVYGAQQDSGTVATTSRSDYGEITFRNWHSVGAGESGYIAPDPSDPNITYAGDTYGGLWRYDNRTGQSQEISPKVVGAFGAPISHEKLRFTWTSPLVFSPQDSRVLYFGAQNVLRSADQGHSWQAISPDLTGCNPAQKNATSPVTNSNAKARCYGVVYTIAPSPKQADVIWAGSDTGLVQLTQDNGKSWANVTPTGLSDWSKITLIEASPFDAGTAYAAVDRHRLDDFSPHIFRTHDFGKTWAEIDAGIPTPAFVHAVREDPQHQGLLFAGTEFGVYVSFDDGDHWQSLQLNLPRASVRDLVVHGNDLVIATHGRSFWILDDISPLRQIADAATSDTHLYKPATAIRIRRDVNNDTPLPPEVPAGENPPTGAILDYWLKSPAQGEVRLEISDSSGRVIRKFSSSDEPAQEKEPPPFAAYWLRPEAPLSTAAGMHRFIWDLRYPTPPTFRPEHTIAAVVGQNTPTLPEGPLVLPGNYQVKLTANGQSFTQPLTVELDPRLKTPTADLVNQFDLAMQVYHAIEQSFAALTEVQNAQRKLQNLKTTASAADLDKKLTALASEYGEQPSFNTLNSAFGQIENVIESADGAPTVQAQQTFAEKEQQFNALLSEWQQLQRQIAAVAK